MTEKVDIYRMGLVFKKFLANGGVHEVDSFADFQTMEHKSYNKVMTILIVGRSFKSFRIRPEKRWICKVESHLVEKQSTSKISSTCDRWETRLCLPGGKAANVVGLM